MVTQIVGTGYTVVCTGCTLVFGWVADPVILTESVNARYAAHLPHNLHHSSSLHRQTADKAKQSETSLEVQCKQTLCVCAYTRFSNPRVDGPSLDATYNRCNGLANQRAAPKDDEDSRIG
ncbi:hypothetical protein BaRGS_00016239 [Batillaria attramentaria]|uniref:Secreted protein n=1 Tax=Batillaria attramentaria TaxID=370345 RepID=A0ABD0L033_9CAEN